MKHLMKIAREAGIYLIGSRSRTVFGDCTTPQQKEKKLLKMLQDAGMHGTAADDCLVMIHSYCICPECVYFADVHTKNTKKLIIFQR